MRAALDVFWETILDWYNGMVGLVMINLVWLAFGLTVILLPPATAGVYSVTNSLAHGTGAHFSDLWQGMRRYAWISYQWALANIAAGVIFVVCFRFYGAAGSGVGVLIQTSFAAVGVLWLTAQFYLWPFLIEQENKRLRLGLKNAIFLTLANPVYTFILLGIVALALFLSLLTVLPIAFFATTFISLLGSRAVRERLTTYGKLPGVRKTGEES